MDIDEPKGAALRDKTHAAQNKAQAVQVISVFLTATNLCELCGRMLAPLLYCCAASSLLASSRSPVLYYTRVQT